MGTTRVHASTGTPRWKIPLQDGEVAGGPILLFDWEPLGLTATALRFVVINTGSGELTVTPEAAYEATGRAESGTVAPAPFIVPPGASYGDPYGIDEMRPYWRERIAGTSTFKWGVMEIPR